MNPDLNARTALISGASSGMGRDYARELASLVLVARRTEPLELLAQELRGGFFLPSMSCRLIWLMKRRGRAFI
jgi:short-subunit dehydrogenase